MNQGTNPHNLRFELTYMNNSDSWTRNIMLDLGDAPHVTGVSPASIKYETDAALAPPPLHTHCLPAAKALFPARTLSGVCLCVCRVVNKADPVLPKVNDFNCVEQEAFVNPLWAHWNFSKAEWAAEQMDVHSVFTTDVKLDRQTFQARRNPLLYIMHLAG